MFRVRGQADPAAQQLRPLGLAEQTVRAAIGGQQSLLGPQNKQVFRLAVAHMAELPGGHRVQHRRNGPHVILAEYQLKQPGKTLGGHGKVPADLVELLQRADQHTIQLAVFQGLLVPALG